MRTFKTFSSRRINALRNASGVPLWQQSHYERVVRDQRELTRIREYIPWALDPENLAAT